MASATWRVAVRATCALLILAATPAVAAPTAVLAPVVLKTATEPDLPDLDLSISGDNITSSDGRAMLMVILTNAGDAPVMATLFARAAGANIQFTDSDASHGAAVRTPAASPVRVELAARDAAVQEFVVQPQADAPQVLTVVVTAHVDGTSATDGHDTIAVQRVTVASPVQPFADVLGSGSVVFVPLVLAWWVVAEVYVRDRRRIGLETKSAVALVWDHRFRTALLAALSVVVGALADALGWQPLGPAARGSTVLLWSAATVMLAATLANVVRIIYRSRIAAIGPTSSESDVLRAAARADNKVNRHIWEGPDGARGLLVHHDCGVVVLTPPLLYARWEIRDPVAQDDLAGVIATIPDPRSKGKFIGYASDGDWVARPRAVLGAHDSGSTRLLLEYRDRDDDESADDDREDGASGRRVEIGPRERP